MSLYLGIDLGTSGCRAIAIDAEGRIRGQAVTALPEPLREGPCVEQDPALWWQALRRVLTALCGQVPTQEIRALAVDGTSGTVLLADEAGRPLGPALLYNDARATAEAVELARIGPAQSAAHGTASGLAKLLWLHRHTDTANARWALHQADWIVGRLTGRWGVSDANNSLKTGYDPVTQRWPDWLARLDLPAHWLPQVFEPGTAVGPIAPAAAAALGLPSQVIVRAGTTDSTAAFLATGAGLPGEAVTSLGSTLVLKVIAERPVFAPEYGVYSQPLGGRWLVGGGSNSGGTVLRRYFTNEQLEQLTTRLRPDAPTGLDYYPLPAPGERFPVCDPRLQPRLEPRPADDAQFLQGLLEGMARIEQQGYQRLAELDAPYPTSVRTVGGGAKNPAWTAIRARLLGVPLIAPQQTEAAYGAALLARVT